MKMLKTLFAVFMCTSMATVGGQAFGQEHDHPHDDDHAGHAHENHGNHSDIKFRAPTWRDLHFADHNMADQWMGWLKQNGFEARHEH